jgi:predicted transposase/invertase (TIGR01784 family)
MNINNKFKNSVFTFLFSEPELLRELYCALEKVDLPDVVPVNINTLEDVLFMERMNDISFEIGGKLVVLIEHQSTINPNMALRLLMYISRVYEKIVKDKKIYSAQKISIPRPEFFVLYNGTAPYPDEKIIKLSDMFESPESLKLPGKENLSLDLAVKVFNINEGKNKEIAERCQTLAEYSAFIAKARDYEGQGASREEALKKAVYYCRNHDILKEFLEQHAKEIMNMLITEWNWDDAKEVWQEEAREERDKEIVRNALAEGVSLEVIQKLPGLNY